MQDRSTQKENSLKAQAPAPRQTVHITFEDRKLEVPAGISVAAAVLGHAHAGHTCTNAVDASKRAPYCLMGVCFECMLEIDGKPDVQSCMVPVAEGMVVNTQKRPAVPGENGSSDQGGRA